MSKREVAAAVLKEAAEPCRTERDVFMNFAEVIVDVTTKNIDRPFDYRIPDKFKGMIKKGMRVIVPFGARKIQGFVTSVKESSEACRPFG